MENENIYYRFRIDLESMSGIEYYHNKRGELQVHDVKIIKENNQIYAMLKKYNAIKKYLMTPENCRIGKPYEFFSKPYKI